jgi:hypothetical protein
MTGVTETSDFSEVVTYVLAVDNSGYRVSYVPETPEKYGNYLKGVKLVFDYLQSGSNIHSLVATHIFATTTQNGNICIIKKIKSFEKKNNKKKLDKCFFTMYNKVVLSKITKVKKKKSNIITQKVYIRQKEHIRKTLKMSKSKMYYISASVPMAKKNTYITE